MNLLLRLVLLGGGLTSLFFATNPEDGLRLLLAGGASGIVIVAAAAAHSGKGRPWSDAMSWLAAAVWLGALGTPQASLPAVVLVVVGLAALVAGLHVPAMDVPRRRGVGALATWSLVALAAVLVAWLPVLLARDDGVAVLDPLTSAGMAMRLAGVAALVWVVAGFLSLRGRRKSS